MEDFDKFFNKIKKEYQIIFSTFIKFFEKNYIISYQYGDLSFNYNSLVKEDISEGIKFYTNNICESFNKTLNTKYIWGSKTIYHFKNELTELLDLYKGKNEYRSRYLSITRAFTYYWTKNKNKNLISLKDVDMIMNEYKTYLHNNKIYDNF